MRIKVSDALPDWQFDKVTMPSGRVLDPNNWTIERDDVRTDRSCVGIYSEDDKVIDEPPDTGQDPLDIVIHGIGWLHAHSRETA
jgi:hypothetical protein